MKSQKKGFTLIELLVVIAIIGLLSTIVLASLNGARAKARDAKRKGDMIELRTALQMYYADHGSYPSYWGSGSGGYWGGVNASCAGTNGQTSGPEAYIQGLTPNYIAILPTDPAINPPPCYGYLYRSDGVEYKLLANWTPESYVSAGQVFYDPVRPPDPPVWMLCSGEPACSTW